MKTVKLAAALDYYDGIQVFSARDGGGTCYIAAAVDQVGDHTRYLVTEAAPERLLRFCTGRLDLRTLLLEAPNGEWYTTVADGSIDDPLTLEPQAGALAGSGYLPDEGFFLEDLPDDGSEAPWASEIERLRSATLAGTDGPAGQQEARPSSMEQAMPTAYDRRLIEDWLPVNELSVEAVREGGALAGHPPVNQLHVWWARRPLVVSRATVAASLLNADADRSRFISAIGTTDTVVAERRRMDEIKATGQWSNIAFSNKRAFTHNLTPAEREWFEENRAGDSADPIVLDVTAGGGSIPFEAGRLGLRSYANELNPVAGIILHATCRWPQEYGNALRAEYDAVSARFRGRVAELLAGVYPPVPQPDGDGDGDGADDNADGAGNPENKNSRIVRAQRYAQTYLWARTIDCYECGREVPLSPNWRLSSKGDGVRLWPDEGKGVCDFEMVSRAAEHSEGTVRQGIARCPYPSCRAASPKGYLAEQAQAGRMGHRLYCVIYRDQEWGLTKAGKESKTPKTRRVFAKARPEDDNGAAVAARLAELLPQWDADDILPDEPKPPGDDNRPITYGMSPWRNMFNPRQQLAHGYCVQAFRELVDADADAGQLDDRRRAAWCYVALALDKMVNRNSLMSTWVPDANKVAQTFATHDFGFKWSYAEMAVTIRGLGIDWAIDDIGDCITELTKMAGHPKPAANGAKAGRAELIVASQQPKDDDAIAPESEVSAGPAQDMDLPNASVDAIVFDPPYHNNVNYAELSDFFYVWLKRTVGYIYPDLCRPYLTDKVNEAIASPARFREQAAGQGQSAGKLATADYEAKMGEIFRECRRVIKPDGIMTVMFTHRTTAAWDALVTGLIGAGFRITRTWPVKTEAEAALNIKGKAAARTTILLVCRPRGENRTPAAWPDVEEQIARAVRSDAPALDAYGLKPTDLYLAAFGPALQVISDHWGAQRASAHPDPARSENPFAVTPTDAMQVARQEVSRHRAAQLSQQFSNVTDPAARFYILSADSVGGDTLEYDDAALMGRVAGLELDSREGRSLVVKNGSRVTLKRAKERQAAGDIGRDRAPATPLDQVHTAVVITLDQDTAAADEWLRMQAIDRNGDAFKGTLQALYGALKPESGATKPEERDREALGNLHRRLYGAEPPRQGELGL